MRGWITGCVAALAGASGASAQTLDKTWLFRIGGYVPRVNTTLQVNAANGVIGTEVDLEADLGFQRTSVLPDFKLEWRPGDDWMLNAEYYRLSRSSSATLARDIAVGDTVFPVSGRVTSGFDSDIIRITVGNRIFQRPGIEIGAAIGLHGTDFSVFIEGEGTVGEGFGSFRSERRSVFAPLPTVGLFVNAQPANRVHVSGRFDWLSLTLDDYSGRLINTQAWIGYSIHRTIDVGAMYRYVDYRVRVRRERWNGSVTYSFSGPAVFVQFGF